MAEMFCARFSLLTLTFYLILSRTRGEVFTALIDLENIVYRERELRSTLEEYVNLEEQRLAKLKKFLAKVNAAHSVVEDDVSRYLGHPVNSYLEIRRMYKEWPEAERLIQLDNSEGKFSFQGDLLAFYRDDEFITTGLADLFLSVLKLEGSCPRRLVCLKYYIDIVMEI